MNHLIPPPVSSSEEIEQLLRQQQRELAILKAIILAVSSSHNLKEMLETALEIVLSVVNSSTGWICLLDDENSCSAFVGYKGLCFSTPEGETPPCLVRCVCNKVRTTGDVVIIRKLKTGCPLLEIDSRGEPPVIGHVSVPLTTQARIVGQLNVAFNEKEHADRMDIDLLKTIGPQLAVAVENARL
jgi:GAF domain-containing protein